MVELLEVAPLGTNSPPIEVRQAVCGGIHNPNDHTTSNYHEIRDSNPNLPFFEYRGSNSDWSKVCKECHFNPMGHDVFGINFSGEHAFIEHGPWEYDSFYCGHNGWD